MIALRRDDPSANHRVLRRRPAALAAADRGDRAGRATYPFARAGPSVAASPTPIRRRSTRLSWPRSTARSWCAARAASGRCVRRSCSRATSRRASVPDEILVEVRLASDGTRRRLRLRGVQPPSRRLRHRRRRRDAHRRRAALHDGASRHRGRRARSPAAQERGGDPRARRALGRRHRRGGRARCGTRRSGRGHPRLRRLPSQPDARPHRTRAAPRPKAAHGSDAERARRTIRLTVNGKAHEGRCEPRKLLVDFLREDLGLTGTHVGCEHGVCGACTVLVNGRGRALVPDARRAGERRRSCSPSRA